ncbi:MAG: sugar phosphate isomerase/epimerase [Bacteroidales bacterium]|nr:sugar phosphate isomerase/epimerase [Bacteroidales bacterium]
MKITTLLPALAILVLGVSGCRGKAGSDIPKISIFCDHIETAARQEGIPFAEAAARIKAFGVTGADIRVFQDPAHIKTLDSLGFAHACAITDIDYSREDTKDLEDKTLAFLEERGFDRLLLVPGLVPRDFSREQRDAARQRIADFAARVTAAGYRIMVEDYDNSRSLCYDAERLDSLFAVSKDLGLAYDSGNFLFAGQDALEQYGHFRDKIVHVHLKDRTSPTDMTSVPAGTGCIPITEIIGRLAGSGYQGWYTVEQYGSRRMLSDSETAIRNVAAALSGSNGQ